MKVLVYVAAAALALVPALAQAEAQAGAIDWQKRVIKCKGSAAPREDAPNIAAARIGAERAAKMDAQRNILETLKGVQVTGSKTAADALKDPGVSSKVQGAIKNFKVTDTRYFSDGGVEVDVEMPLDGLIDDLAPPAKKAEADPAATGTGIVVDAKALKVAPALAPRIVDEEGNEIYGPGAAGYASDLDAAQKDPRVAGSPVVVKAMALAKGTSSDVVISKEDAKKAKTAKLATGNVVFVVAQ